ncbi:4-diphosphocytidyl-2-C-methyl-D-erythritol kinase [Corynebacterium ciconiae DSM 44920]|uniref:4-(cytidine 5'-diphospho)-2-C-methyl-D-erythritol kinase n=1 Tax=Corynebacterium ciconiae TaxID=227319 RepID=UPI00035FD82F|nr:4-(cytidine 5'-diphospho)-2-C-methyl-D-erythritol kinase [Corynebacterium ciconiae]WKD61628.1 4-diphosphocytidyl-2-C-methyl-D-erythritol kinase [Corynebacterium ciconiae DSM 44920]
MSFPTTSVRACAKINFFLGVGAARADGFHELTTVFQSLSNHNVVRLSPASGPAQLGEYVASVSASGLAARSVPLDASNLVVAAASRYLAEVAANHPEIQLPVLDIHIHKGIPTAGGMAGGSADAAAVLHALSDYAPLPRQRVLEIAAELGSDVPFSLVGGTQLGTGRGERLVPMLSRGTYHLALGIQKQGLKTPEVFAKLDEMRAAGKTAEPNTDTSALATALVSGKPAAVAAEMHNDLQPAALSLMPALRATLAAGKDAGALCGIVSGSGPTTAFLCDSADAAEVVAEDLRDSGTVFDAFAVHTVPQGIGSIDT